MRYSVLVYIFNMLKTLLEANKALGEIKDKALRKDLIDNGLQMINLIKDKLELEEKSIKDVTLIKKLDTILSSWGNVEKQKSIEEELNSLVLEMPNSVEYKIRVVFFAELGQKWDSMESVYEYMLKDDIFDPIVVLTPIFRIVKDENGNDRNEVIYKDYLTDMGIPFFEYNQYNIEEDCPDLAFISQPYESCTLPQFWPEYISKFTRLVYLPYYAPSVIGPDSRNALCLLPIYKYAWKVLALNQNHYDYYKENKTYECNNILLTGIPKLDHIFKINQEEIEMPKEWIKISGKKTVLWCSWYVFDDSSLIYMDEILDWFSEHKDWALIWRLHPMTEVVTKLYYSDKDYEKYIKAIKRVNESNNMVIDSNALYDKAFKFSKIMLSDYSSMMEQYLLMNKPIIAIRDTKKCPISKTFIDYTYMDMVSTFDDAAKILENIGNGIDLKKEKREEVIKKDFPFSDGHCGERVCKELVALMKKEDLEL